MYVALYCDAETMRHIGAPMTPEDARASFRLALKRSKDQPLLSRFYAMLEADSGRAVGICGIQSFDSFARTAELGMMLIAQARARGHATEGLAALVTAAFAIFPIDTVWVQYSQEHAAAERLVIDVGFVRCSGENLVDACEAKRVWSINRSSWGFSSPSTATGEERHVERDRLS